MTRTPIGHDLLEAAASLDVVDKPAKAIAKVARDLKRPQAINEALSGTWLGHPVHPMLIALPIGSWISAVLLDLLGGEDAETAADLLVGAGVAAAVPTVATGYALSNTCVHRGGQLSEGELEDGCVVCPLHSSTFRLEDGAVERGPAAYPQPVLEARVRDGAIEVRAAQGG